MKKLKFLSLVLAGAMLVTTAFTGCGNSNSASSSNASAASAASGTSTTSGKKIKVALVLTGSLGDKSYNDSCYAGLQRAQKKYGIEVKVLESNNSSDWPTNLISMASAGYDLVIASSTQLEDTLKKEAPNFPDVKFGIIDDEVKGDNVISAIFAQNQASFLVGAAAAMATTNTKAFANMNDKKIISAVGGMDIPVIHDFMVGYEQGAKYIDSDMEVLVSYAGNFNDPVKGKELALAQFNQGSDIVFNVAASTGLGAMEAASTNNKYSIGGDTNEDSMYPGSVLISELKNVDVATYMMAQEVCENKFKAGVVKLNIKNGGVGCSDMSVMKEKLGDKFPEEIPEKLAQITADMKSGKIVVKHAEGFTD